MPARATRRPPRRFKPGAIGLSGSTVSRAFIQASATTSSGRDSRQRASPGRTLWPSCVDGKTFAAEARSVVLAVGIAAMTWGQTVPGPLSRRTMARTSPVVDAVHPVLGSSGRLQMFPRGFWRSFRWRQDGLRETDRAEGLPPPRPGATCVHGTSGVCERSW